MLSINRKHFFIFITNPFISKEFEKRKEMYTISEFVIFEFLNEITIIKRGLRMDRTRDLYTTTRLQEERKENVKQAFQQGRISNMVMSDNINQANTIIDSALTRINAIEKEEKAKKG